MYAGLSACYHPVVKGWNLLEAKQLNSGNNLIYKKAYIVDFHKDLYKDFFYTHTFLKEMFLRKHTNYIIFFHSKLIFEAFIATPPPLTLSLIDWLFNC